MKVTRAAAIDMRGDALGQAEAVSHAVATLFTQFTLEDVKFMWDMELFGDHTITASKSAEIE